MQVGYVRSSDPAAIVEASRRMDGAQCARTLIDAVEPGGRAVMTGALKALVATLKPGDTLTVVQLDHIAPMPGLLDALVELVDAGIVVSSLNDRLTTEDAPIRAALMTLGRYTAGPRESRGRGRTRALNEKALERARHMIEADGMRIVDVANALHVSRATIYRHLGCERDLRQAGRQQQALARHPEPA